MLCSVMLPLCASLHVRYVERFRQAPPTSRASREAPDNPFWWKQQQQQQSDASVLATPPQETSTPNTASRVRMGLYYYTAAPCHHIIIPRAILLLIPVATPTLTPVQGYLPGSRVWSLSLRVSSRRSLPCSPCFPVLASRHRHRNTSTLWLDRDSAHNDSTHNLRNTSGNKKVGIEREGG